jgi:phage shock protein A
VDDDFDLEGLSRVEARAYVAQFVQSLHLARKQRAEREAEFEKWKSRTKLAAERGEEDLARAALERAEEAQSSLNAVRREERELEFKVTELKRRLGNLRDSPELSVNADALLEQLQAVVGTDHQTDHALEEAEAQVALDSLRRKMAEDGDETS